MRHGDVLLVIIDTLPDNIKKSDTRVFLHGRNNDHYIDNGDIYLYNNPDNLKEDVFDYGYIVAKNTTLYHNEHGIGETNKTAKIADGIYQLYKQKEFTSDGFKIIED